MSWINSQPFIVPAGDFYNSQYVLPDYASINPNQPVDCCPQQQPPLYLSLPDYNTPSYTQSLMNLQFSDFSQYIAGEQTFIENDNDHDHDPDHDLPHPPHVQDNDNNLDDDDDSDTSSEYSVPSPAEHTIDGYFTESRSEIDQGESINALLQRQNFSYKHENLAAYCPPPSSSPSSSITNNSNNQAIVTSPVTTNPSAIFAAHPLYNTLVALDELWASAQDRMQEFSGADFRSQAETLMNVASSNLATAGGIQYPGDSVIRFQIGWLLEQLAEGLIAFDPKSAADYACYSPDGVSVDPSIPVFNDFTQMSASTMYHGCSSVSRDVDSESSSDDTIKEEYPSSMSAAKCSMKRKRDTPSTIITTSTDDDDDQDDGTEEDVDDEDDFSKRGSMPNKDAQKKRRENYTPDISFELFSWWFDNDGAAPNALAKQDLATKTGKTISQIATWYQNAKRRYSARLEDFRSLKAQRPHEVRDYGTYESYTRSQGSGSTTKRRRVQ